MATSNIVQTGQRVLQSIGITLGGGQLMALGDFVFSISTAAYQQIDRQNSWRHPSNEPIGTAPTYQYTGPGAETFTFSGIIYREYSNPKALDTLRDMANAGKAYALVGISGKVFGFYSIEDLNETQSYFDDFGEPLRIDFTLSLIKVHQPEVEI